MKNSGFSLVELSIVLVILGLLVGGILGGQALIRAAELRSIPTQLNQFQTAVNTFKDKYFALPGDIKNATSFWGNTSTGSTGGECTSQDTALGSGTQTCNGDGSGLLEQNDNEILRFWQHLANAGLIDGNYTGTKSSTNSYSSTPGVNCPKGKMGNSGWAARAYTISAPFSGDTHHYDGNALAGNMYRFASHSPNETPNSPILTPAEAWNVDTKMDDGIPGTGKVMAFGSDGWNNASGTLARCTLAQNSSQHTQPYAVNQEGVLCALMFLDAF